MTSIFFFHLAINLCVGTALLFAWHRDRRQAFLRWVGLAFLVQASTPVAFLAYHSAQPLLHAAGSGALAAIASLALGLVAIGVAHLAHRPLGRTAQRLVVALLMLGALALGAIDVRLVQNSGAALNVALGLAASVWLWPLGRAERLSGVLLVLVGLNQFDFVWPGAGMLEQRAAAAALLRLLLGLTLLHAAVRRSAAESLVARDRFMRLTEHSHQGVAVVRGEQLLYANPALLQIYGLRSLDEVRTLWRDATMPENERAAGRERHRQLLDGTLPQANWAGLRYRFDGAPIQLRFSAWRIDWDGEPAEQLVVTDETAQLKQRDDLLHQATHDELTGLPNRSALLTRLRDLCAQHTGFALLLLDVDRFKLFNEAHGHSVGDEVLRALAERLTHALQGRAEVMRLGEDEFALLATAADSERTAHQVAQSVRELLALPLALPGHEFFLDVSMGVALHPAQARDPEALLRAANAAMHEAKRTPGTSVQFAEERFERGSGDTLLAEQALRAGLKNEEFTLLYQPKVEVRAPGATPRLVGFEALVRWDRPGRGRINPLEFVPAAERTGLIGALGTLILAQACAQVAAWRATLGDCVPVAVNVSPLQLLDPGFPELVVNTLQRFDVPPALLSLEITESAAVTHMEQAREQIAQLRLHGVEVALDDFGTGFSSLNMLRSLPLRTVKIDRTLIEPMPAPDATAVVKAICDIASALDLDLIAEGVETEAQARAALAAGCRVLQGYLYARPLAAAEAARWVAGAVSKPARLVR